MTTVQSTGCDIIGQQETDRAGQAYFASAGYGVYFSGSTDGPKTPGVGIAVRSSIVREGGRVPEFVNNRTLKVRIQMMRKSNVLTYLGNNNLPPEEQCGFRPQTKIDTRHDVRDTPIAGPQQG